MQIKFENNSVSGIFREYAGFVLNVPGHAIGNKAVVVAVPDHLVADVTKFVSAQCPAMVITKLGKEAATEDVAVEDTIVEEEQTEEAEAAVDTTETVPTATTFGKKHKGGR